MSLLRRSSLRFLTRHPGQLALTVLGVALGVAVVVAIDLAIQSSRAAFQVSTETVAGRATHQVVGGPAGLPASVLTELRVELGIRASAPVVEGYALSDELPGRGLRILGVDPFSERPFRPYLAPGSGELEVSVLLTEPRALFVSRGTADDAGLAPGDRLPLLVGGQRVDGALAGILEPESGLGTQGLRDLLLMDVATAQEILEMPGRLTRIDLVLPDGESGRALLARVEEALPQGAFVQTTGTRTEQMSGMLAAFDLNLRALSLLALVFGMFLIYNAMTFSVVQRRELLGALRAAGVTRGEITRLVLGESLITGLVGSALGLGLGIVLGRGLVGLVTQTINDLYFVLSVESLQLPVWSLVKGGVMGVGATFLAGLPAIREAVNAPPRASLTRSVVEDRTRELVPRAAALGAALGVAGALALALSERSLLVAFLGLFGILLGVALVTPLATVGFVRLLRPLLAGTVGILGTLAARGVVAALSRTAPAVAALVVAVSVTVGLGTMIASFRGTVVRWLDHTLQADVYISPLTPMASRAEGTLPPELVERLRSAPFIEGVSTYRGVTAPGPEEETRLVALDLHPRGEASFAFIEGDAVSAFRAFRAGEGVIVSEPFAYRRGLELGDPVPIPGARTPTSLPVAGIFTDYGSEQGVVMMSRLAYDRLFDDPGITSLGFFLPPGADAEEAVARFQGMVGDDEVVFIRSNQGLRQASLEVFDRTFAITAVLRALAFAVAFIGVLSALMALQLERARELGVLRANGLTPGQVWTLVTTQTGIMGLVAGVLAIPAGLLLAVIMIYVVNRRSFGWTLQMEAGPELFLQAVLLAVLGALLAGLIPAWRMSRTSPAVALRDE
jgi:putative ABC transport system permease protein